MQDSIIAGNGNSRYLRTSLPAGTTWDDALAMLRAGTFPIDLAGLNAAGFTQLGTVLNTQTLLSDETAETLGLTNTAVPSDAFLALLVMVQAKADSNDIPTAYQSNPQMDGVASPGSSSDWSRGDHVHPHDTSKQDTLTFDETPTEGSTNPVTSGGVYAAEAETNAQVEANTSNIETLQTETSEHEEDIKYLYVSLLDGTEATYRKVMKAFFLNRGANAATAAELTALVDEWYAMTRDDWNGYSTFYQKGVSNVSTGTKGGDNAGLTCVPSTDTAANTDDYAGLPLFAPTDVNYEIDADTLEPVITGIKGITDSFERDNPDKLVGVIQMSGWHWRDELTETFVEGYSSQEQSGHDYCAPVPEAVRVDGTMRDWIVHTKYMGHVVNGAMRAYAGVIPTAWQSHNTLQTRCRANGSQYGGGSVLLQSWLTLMTRIKYDSLTLDGIIQGCLNYNFQYVAAHGETGVKRVLLTAAQAANMHVGAGVLIGTLNSALSKDRSTDACYSVTGQAGAIITGKEVVNIDGTDYTAVYVDTAATFDTAGDGSNTEGNTLISTFHWPCGTNDAVLGNDGSIVNTTNAQYPAKLQGIEFITGSYEVFGDIILSVNPPDTDNEFGTYTSSIADLAANQATSVTANYRDGGVTCPMAAATAAWRYISVEGFSDGLYMPQDVTGGSSTTYTRDAFYQQAQVSAAALREWLSFALLNRGSGFGGLSCVDGTAPLASAAWYFGGRPSACANRGAWGAATQ